MVAIDQSMSQRIRSVQSEIEPYIIEMIKGSSEGTCPIRMMKGADLESTDMKYAVTQVARILYKTGLLHKIDLSLSDDEAIDTLLYAFGYWGGQTLNKHGKEICQCQDRCY